MLLHALLASVVITFIGTNCQQFIDGDCVAYIHNLTGIPHRCDAIIEQGELVFLHTNESQADRQQDLEMELSGIDLLDVVGGSQCKQTSVSFGCQSMFQKCNASLPGGVTIPCITLCERIAIDCEPFLSFGTLRPPDCTNTTIASTECNETVSSDVENELTCFPPHLLPDTKTTAVGLNEAPCFKCPAPAYSDKSYDILFGFSAALGFIGLVLMLVAFFVFLSAKDSLDFQNQFFLIISADSFISGLCMFICGVAPKFILCENDARMAHTWHVPCTIQGTVFYFSGVQIVLTWGVMAFNLAYITNRGIKFIAGKYPLWYKIVISCIIWGLPSVMSFILLVSGLIESVPALTLCFISVRYEWAQWMFFFGFPVIPATLVGFISFSYVIYNLYQGPASSTSKKKEQARNLVFAFIITYFAMVLYIFSFRFYADYRVDSISFPDLLQCIVLNGGIENCEVEVIKLPAVILFIFFIGCNGSLFFIAFMFSRKFRKLAFNAINPLLKMSKTSSSAASIDTNSKPE